MKLKTTPEQHPAFLKALQQCESVSQTSKTIIQALGSVLIAAKPGAVSIQANNLEQAIVTEVSASVTVPGSVGINAKDLSRIAKIGKSIEIEITKTEAIVKCGGVFRLPILAAGEFPPLPEMGEGGKEYEFAESEVCGFLACGYAASSPNDQRYALQGVCINPENKQGVASDGKRLSCSSFPVSREGWGLIVPTAACRILDSLIGGCEKLTMEISPAHVKVTIGETTFYTRLVEGNFPNIAQTVPKPDFGVAINREELLSGLDRVLVAQNESNQVKLALSKSEITLTIVGKNAKAETTVDLDVKGPEKAKDFSITVDSGFLREACYAMRQDVITLEFVDNLTPMAIKGDSFAIIMPMRTT